MTDGVEKMESLVELGARQSWLLGSVATVEEPWDESDGGDRWLGRWLGQWLHGSFKHGRLLDGEGRATVASSMTNWLKKADGTWF